MRKLIVTCDCGQRLQVPYSALGRTGTCTTCGRTLQILPENARRETVHAQREAMTLRESRWQRMATVADDIKQLFGKAVDLFNEQRYAEALAILDTFAQRFPDNPDIEQARAQCIDALRRPKLAGPGPEQKNLLPDDAKLDEETVKRVVLDKLLHGATPSIQLNAAEIACKLLGLFSNNHNGMESTAPKTKTPQNAQRTTAEDVAQHAAETAQSEERPDPAHES